VKRPAQALAGIGLAVAACACFASLDTSTKFVGRYAPLVLVLWARYLFQLMATLAVVMPTRGWIVWRTRHVYFQLMRGIALLLTSATAFIALRYMPVGEFSAIVMITPLAMTVVAATVLKERVSALAWTLVAGGFAGTLIIMRPGGAFTIASLLPVCVVVFNVAFQLLTAKLARTEDPITTHLWSGGSGAVLVTLALPFVWTTDFDPRLWFVFAFMGFMSTIGHFLLILAFSRAKASTLMPFLYSQIFFSTFAGWLIFHYVPDATSLFGMVLIAVCGAGAAWLTRREAQSRETAG
jgi:drug/metabolite transporter (DMT)-like permease